MLISEFQTSLAYIVSSNSPTLTWQRAKQNPRNQLIVHLMKAGDLTG